MVQAARQNVAIVPDVFADRDAQPHAVNTIGDDLAAGLEVAIFVEHVVGRQQRLVPALDDPAAWHSATALNSGLPAADGLRST